MEQGNATIVYDEKREIILEKKRFGDFDQLVLKKGAELFGITQASSKKTSVFLANVFYCLMNEGMEVMVDFRVQMPDEAVQIEECLDFMIKYIIKMAEEKTDFLISGIRLNDIKKSPLNVDGVVFKNLGFELQEDGKYYKKVERQKQF
ncbi:MAG: hypothetical protein PHE54_02270 [Bacilli bacterium]|nr:hypothetical protein [Bacilli bacterium]